MKTTTLFLPLLLAGGLAACHNEAATSTANLAGAAADTAEAPTTSPAAALLPAATPPPATPPRYDVRGIFDPGMGGIIAAAFKVPHGWQVQQSFKRDWINNYPVEQVYVGFFSPDGHQSFEGLPTLHYSYYTTPQGRQMVEGLERMSGHHDPSQLAPLLPLAYLKQVLLPMLAQKAKLHPRVVAEHQDPMKELQPSVQGATGYFDCVLPNGRKLRVQTQITVAQLPTGPAWTADNLLIQTDGDLAAAAAQQAAIQKSEVMNPTWVRQNEEMKSRGMDLNTEQGKAATERLMAQQKLNNEQFQQRMAAQRQQFDQHHANWMAQQHANDQSSQAFRDYLGGQTLYQNPETGQRTRVDNTYTHVYQDGQGNTLGTNAPLDAGHVNWQQLQQVELKNY